MLSHVRGSPVATLTVYAMARGCIARLKEKEVYYGEVQIQAEAHQFTRNSASPYGNITSIVLEALCSQCFLLHGAHNVGLRR